MSGGLQLFGHDGDIDAHVTKLGHQLNLMQDMPQSSCPHPMPSRSPETVRACDKEPKLSNPPTPPSPERRRRGARGSSKDSDSLPRRNRLPTSPCSITCSNVAPAEAEKSSPGDSGRSHKQQEETQACGHPLTWLNDFAKPNTDLFGGNQQIEAPPHPNDPPVEKQKPLWSCLEDISPPSTTQLHFLPEHSVAATTESEGGGKASSAPADPQSVPASTRAAGSAHSAPSLHEPQICSGPEFPGPALQNLYAGEAISRSAATEHARDGALCTDAAFLARSPGTPTTLSSITPSPAALRPSCSQPSETATAGTRVLIDQARLSSSSIHWAASACRSEEKHPALSQPLNDPDPASPASQGSGERPAPSRRGLHMLPPGASGPCCSPVEAPAGGQPLEECSGWPPAEEEPSPRQSASQEAVGTTCSPWQCTSGSGRPERANRHPAIQVSAAKVHPIEISPTSADGSTPKLRLGSESLLLKLPSPCGSEQPEPPCSPPPNIQSPLPTCASYQGSTFQVWQAQDIPRLALQDMAEVHVWARLFQSSARQWKEKPAAAPHALPSPRYSSMTSPAGASWAAVEDPAAPQLPQLRPETVTCSQAAQTDDLNSADLIGLKPQGFPPTTCVQFEAKPPAGHTRPEVPLPSVRGLAFDEGCQVDSYCAGASLPPSSHCTSHTDLRQASCSLSPGGDALSDCSQRVSPEPSRVQFQSSLQRGRAGSPTAGGDVQEGRVPRLLRDRACSAAMCVDQVELADILGEALGRDLALRPDDTLLNSDAVAECATPQGLAEQAAPTAALHSDDTDPPSSHRPFQMAQAAERRVVGSGSKGLESDEWMSPPRGPSPIPVPPRVRMNEAASQTDCTDALAPASTSDRDAQTTPAPQIGRTPHGSTRLGRTRHGSTRLGRTVPPASKPAGHHHPKAWKTQQGRVAARIRIKRPVPGPASSPSHLENPRVSPQLSGPTSGKCSTAAPPFGTLKADDGSLQGQRNSATEAQAVESAGLHIGGDARGALVYLPVQVWVHYHCVDVIPLPGMPLPLQCDRDGAAAPGVLAQAVIQSGPATTAPDLLAPQAGNRVQVPAPTLPDDTGPPPDSEQVGMMGAEMVEAPTASHLQRAEEALREPQPGTGCGGMAARLWALWQDVATLHPLSPPAACQTVSPYHRLSYQAASPPCQRPHQSQEEPPLLPAHVLPPTFACPHDGLSTPPSIPARVQSGGLCTHPSAQPGGDSSGSHADGTELDGPCFSNTGNPVVDHWSLPDQAELVQNPPGCLSSQSAASYLAEGKDPAGWCPPHAAGDAHKTPPRSPRGLFHTPPHRSSDKDCDSPPSPHTESSSSLPAWLSQNAEARNSWPSGLQKEDGESMADVVRLSRGSHLHRYSEPG